MRAWRQRWAAVFGCGGDATAIGSGDDVSLHLQGVEGDEGVDQSTMRGSREGNSLEKGIGGGGGSKSGCLNDGVVKRRHRIERKAATWDVR
jgi:hypothetical protein